MSQYNTSTISVTNGSATVAGDVTAWLANVAAGDLLTVVGDGVLYQVASVASDTSLTLATNYAGTTGSGKPYTIVTSFTTNYGWPYPEKGDIETASIVKRALAGIDAKVKSIDDRVTALEP